MPRATTLLILTLTAALAAPLADADQAFRQNNLQTFRQAYEIAENWVRRGQTPKEWDLPLSVRDLRAVHATLRREGKVFVSATATVVAPADPQATPPDAMHLVHRAVTSALKKDANLPLDRETLLKPVHLELQFGGPLTLMRVKKHQQLIHQFAQKSHGLALNKADAWAWDFPGDAIAANTSLKNQMFQLLRTLDIHLAEVFKLGLEEGAPIYRFPVVHLVRQSPKGPIVSLVRGSPIGQPQPLNGRQAAALAAQQIDYILSRQIDTGLFEDVQEPATGIRRRTPAIAINSAVAAYALARGAQHLPAQDKRRTLVNAALTQAMSALSKLQLPQQDKPAPITPRVNSVAFALRTLLEMPLTPELKNERSRFATQLLMMQQPTGRFDAFAGAAQPQPATHQGQALGASAMVGLYELKRDPKTLKRAQAAVAAAWTMLAKRDDGHAVLPWLPLAEFDLARLGHKTPTFDKAAEACKSLWDRQITLQATMPPNYSPDNLGGFLIGGTIYPEPNWTSAKALATNAAALRTKGLVPDTERVGWLLRCAWGARYLRQLVFQPEGAYYVKDPASVVGGTRRAPWDSELQVSISAMSLIAIAELQATLSNWGK